MTIVGVRCDSVQVLNGLISSVVDPRRQAMSTPTSDDRRSTLSMVSTSAAVPPPSSAVTNRRRQCLPCVTAATWLQGNCGD